MEGDWEGRWLLHGAVGEANLSCVWEGEGMEQEIVWRACRKRRVRKLPTAYRKAERGTETYKCFRACGQLAIVIHDES